MLHVVAGFVQRPDARRSSTRRTVIGSCHNRSVTMTAMDPEVRFADGQTCQRQRCSVIVQYFKHGIKHPIAKFTFKVLSLSMPRTILLPCCAALPYTADATISFQFPSLRSLSYRAIDTSAYPLQLCITRHRNSHTH